MTGFISCIPSAAPNDESRSSLWPFLLWDSDMAFNAKAGLGPPAEPVELQDVSESKTSRQSLRRAPAIDGSLQRLREMPLDVVYEIFSHLEPIDLLNLSRTSRSLRDLLLSRENTRFLWRYVLANVRDLPASPTDLNELQYANLAFDESCHFCSEKGVKDVYWLCRVRCCSKCRKRQFISREELECWIPEELSLFEPDSLFPYATSTECNDSQPESMLYFVPAVKEYLLEVSQLLGDSDGKGIEEWIKTKIEIQTERIKHAALCKQWYNIWLDRPLPSYLSRIPLFDMSVTLVLSFALVYLWKDKLLG